METQGYLGRVVVIASQKGGVGKTTTAINLAASLAGARKRVLLVDLDPQSNATAGLAVGEVDLGLGSYGLLMAARPAQDFIVHTKIPLLDMIPATMDLVGAEVEFIDIEQRLFRLKNALASLVDRFDYIIVDCPPSLGILSLNALVAADRVLVPVQCEFFALEGLVHLQNTIKRLGDALPLKYEHEEIVLTMVNLFSEASRATIADMRNFFGDRMFVTEIRRHDELASSQSEGKPVFASDPNCRAADAYIDLAYEMISRDQPPAGPREGWSSKSERQLADRREEIREHMMRWLTDPASPYFHKEEADRRFRSRLGDTGAVRFDKPEPKPADPTMVTSLRSSLRLSVVVNAILTIGLLFTVLSSIRLGH